MFCFFVCNIFISFWLKYWISSSSTNIWFESCWNCFHQKCILVVSSFFFFFLWSYINDIRAYPNDSSPPHSITTEFFQLNLAVEFLLQVLYSLKGSLSSLNRKQEMKAHTHTHTQLVTYKSHHFLFDVWLKCFWNKKAWI